MAIIGTPEVTLITPSLVRISEFKIAALEFAKIGLFGGNNAVDITLPAAFQPGSYRAPTSDEPIGLIDGLCVTVNQVKESVGASTALTVTVNKVFIAGEFEIRLLNLDPALTTQLLEVYVRWH